MRILLDTDIGDDIDDALALALALRHPHIEIAGVTTVFRDTRARARMARHLLTQYGYGDVPVYVGAGKPLLEPMPREPHEPQLDMTPDDVQRIDGIHAVEAIRAMYAQPGSDVTLVTIGPLTNLALALALDPTLAQRIPRDRKSTRLNSSHANISYAVFCLKKKKKTNIKTYSNKSIRPYILITA